MSGKGNRAQVVMCSEEASRHQIFAGMKLSEAKAVCSDLLWKDYDEQLYGDAQKKLSRQLIACSPKVTALEPGIFLLDAIGLGYVGGEQKMCRDMQKIAGRAGYADIHIGIADNAFAATIASKFKRRQFFIVNAEEDAKFLSPLSIKHLAVSEEMQCSLHELGVRTMGQLAALSEESLRQRFGRDGVIARELCQGADRRQPYLPPIEREFKCSVDLGAPIELLYEIQFVLKSMVDRLTRELRDQGWWAEELQLAFFSNNDKFEERPIKLLRPSNHAKFVLEVMKLSLEATPLTREVTAIELSINRYSKEAWSQTPIETSTSSGSISCCHAGSGSISCCHVKQAESESVQLSTSDLDNASLSLTLMLQRFVSRLGEDAVVKSVPNDNYLPEQAGAWLPVAHKPSTMPVLPVNIAYINARTGPTGLTAGLALRRCQPPQPVLVEFQGEKPKSLTYQGRWYTVKEITEPERLSSLWWDQSAKRSYYVALIEPRESRDPRASRAARAVIQDQGLLAMLVNDHDANAWFINGFYD